MIAMLTIEDARLESPLHPWAYRIGWLHGSAGRLNVAKRCTNGSATAAYNAGYENGASKRYTGRHLRRGLIPRYSGIESDA